MQDNLPCRSLRRYGIRSPQLIIGVVLKVMRASEPLCCLTAFYTKSLSTPTILFLDLATNQYSRGSLNLLYRSHRHQIIISYSKIQLFLV